MELGISIFQLENSEKKPWSRLNQVEDRISGLDDKAEGKQMILIVQERSMQRIWDTIKRPTLQIIARIEGEKSQVKDRDKIFHKIVEENNLKWKKDIFI